MDAPLTMSHAYLAPMAATERMRNEGEVLGSFESKVGLRVQRCVSSALKIGDRRRTCE